MQRAATSPAAPGRGPRSPASHGGQPAAQEILTAPAGPGGSSGRILSRGSGLLDSSPAQGWAASSLRSIRLF